MAGQRKKIKEHRRRIAQAIRLADEDAAVQGELGRRGSHGKPWSTMAGRGLLGWSIPAVFGGAAARFSDVLPAVEAFAAGGGRPGLALSWMVHLIVGKVLIAGHGNARQKKEILPGMAAGRITVSIALSEPGAGNDPKRIRTTAVRKKGHYVLNGEKAWLTNGPLADLFIVFAVTGEREGRKQFTAFLVPREAAGLTVQETPPLGYLGPSPHCSIRLEDCAVPEICVLGRKGRAWEDLSKRFRVVEDALLGGVIVGGLERQLREIARGLKESKRDIGNEFKERIGAVAAQIDAARQIAQGAARDLDGRPGTDVENKLVALHLLAKTLQESIDGIREEAGNGRAPGTLGNDVARLIGLGTQASRARQRKRADKILVGKETS